MRKILLAILLIMSLGLGCRAQKHYKSELYVGGKAGVNLSYVFFNPSIPQSWPVNPMMGAMFRYVEEKNFGLIAELNWVRRGWAENFEGLPFRYRRNVDFINIPVLAHIYFGRQKKFFVNLGPDVSFCLGESTQSNFNPEEITSIPDFPLRNRRNEQLTEKVSQKIDFGVSAGLGFEYFINPKNALNFEARYYFGLGNLLPSGRQDTFRASNMMTIAMTFGYWFKL